MNHFEFNNTHADFQGYRQLIQFYDQNSTAFLENLHVSFSQWFSAQLSAPLAGVFDRLKLNFNDIEFDSLPENIHNILSKNNFLSYYGLKNIPDIHKTTIPFLKLSPNDGRYFKNYVRNELLNRPELPVMSEILKRKISETIFEIFENARIHSQTNNIYVCGQYYPHLGVIAFTIADTGIGFKENINNRFQTTLTSVQAIKWAITDKNTTKLEISGGIGLALLKEFIILNQGKFQIVSDDGYFELSHKGESSSCFTGKYPGSIVNMEFNTNDRASYCLSEETAFDDLF